MCRGEEMNSWADVSVCFLLVNFLQQDLILYFLKNAAVPPPPAFSETLVSLRSSPVLYAISHGFFYFAGKGD